jgi:glycosyltransferase involved in cell wall biosynthesis
MLRVDLHLHSRFSDRPSEWILRRLGVPQSYSDPETLYQQLDRAGMTFKTITDHNRIDGALSIAHHPDVFLSEEVTTYFPDGCKIHLLVWNLDESQHAEIQTLRPNIFELSAYLRQQRLAHAVAHALVGLNRQLTAGHFEKLILLFKIFEGRNSNREPLAQETANFCLRSLTPKKIEELASRHGLAPTHPEPHQKILTGGSDDHSGLYVARAYTQGKDGKTVADFFTALERGEIEAIGDYGDPLRLSSGIYSIAFNFAQDRLRKNAPMASSLLGKMAERFVAGKNPADFSLRERLGHLTQAIRTGQALDFVKPGETTLAREIGAFFSDAKIKKALDQIIAAEPDASARSFRMASYLVNQLSYRLCDQFLKRLHKGNLLDALQAFTGLIPIGASVLPYIVAFRQQAPDRPHLEAIARKVTGELPPELRRRKTAWFTDTLEDVNGVARTIRTMTLAARKAGADITVLTSRSDISITDIPIKNFAPVGEFEIPEYELQKLSFPPLLEMIDYIQREGFTELIISTPGPIGLAALAAGKLLGLRMSGIYHTDFPQYARFLSDDSFMETIVWSYMQWFYGQMDVIYSNSEYYRQRWIERGIRPERLKIFPRGLDTELFSPSHRNEKYWVKRGAIGPVVLYVGRISKEKELGFLADLLNQLKRNGVRFTAALVGDGPYLDELKKQMPDTLFTGILTGLELGIAYASADVFVFPSTTDTFGNVVIEAMAAGLPVIVSDVGGPKELVKNSQQGFVLPARDLEKWSACLTQLINNPRLPADREKIGSSVHDERRWDAAFAAFWG